MNDTPPNGISTDSCQQSTTVEAQLFDGLQLAFQNSDTGESHLSQSNEGEPTNVYDFSGLPECWIAERDSSGRAVALKPEVIAGYWLNGKFVALSQISTKPHDA